MGRIGSKEKIRQFLLANIGRVIESHELQEAAGGAAQYGRRLRELREEEGWPILSHNDTTDLKPGQYMLREKPPSRARPQFARTISAKLRAEVLDRNGFTCQMCGLSPGDLDPATLQESEISTARRLATVSLRAAGALLGVVIEGHLQKVAVNHSVKIAKKEPTIADLSEPLKASGVIDIPTWRKISYLADLRNICSHKKGDEPTKEQVEELIQGADWLTKNVS
ncbi:MAG: hypothetical protein WC712_11025 [Candidatus Brocadiia bacterium]